MPKYINDDIEISSDDSDREVSDEEISNEENSDEENFNEESIKSIKVYKMYLFLYLMHFE